MSTHRFIFTVFLVGVAITLVSCGAPGQGSPSNTLQLDLSRALSPYQVLDLTTGQMSGFVELPDVQTNDAYRQNLMVFHLVPAGTTVVGTPTGALGAGVDASTGSIEVGGFYCGAFEVTQGQWATLAGTATRPWENVAVVPAGALGALTTSAKRPAYALTEDGVAAALATHNAGKSYRLGIPTDVQWERACRAGSATAFSWGGNPNDRTAALSYAVVAETTGTVLGTRQVGERTANAFGLFDMHGNVWEITHTGLSTSIRGGSWRDPLSLARSAHVVPFDRATAHGLVGVRLVLVP